MGSARFFFDFLKLEKSAFFYTSHRRGNVGKTQKHAAMLSVFWLTSLLCSALAMGSHHYSLSIVRDARRMPPPGNDVHVDVTLMFVSCNRPTLLNATIYNSVLHMESLERTLVYEIVWVDSATAAEARAWIRNSYQFDVVVHAAMPRGYVWSMNVGFSVVRGRYLWLIEEDRVTENLSSSSSSPLLRADFITQAIELLTREARAVGVMLGEDMDPYLSQLQFYDLGDAGGAEVAPHDGARARDAVLQIPRIGKYGAYSNGGTFYDFERLRRFLPMQDEDAVNGAVRRAGLGLIRVRRRAECSVFVSRCNAVVDHVSTVATSTRQNPHICVGPSY
jgi:hypothetical protein